MSAEWSSLSIQVWHVDGNLDYGVTIRYKMPWAKTSSVHIGQCGAPHSNTSERYAIFVIDHTHFAFIRAMLGYAKRLGEVCSKISHDSQWLYWRMNQSINQSSWDMQPSQDGEARGCPSAPIWSMAVSIAPSTPHSNAHWSRLAAWWDSMSATDALCHVASIPWLETTTEDSKGVVVVR